MFQRPVTIALATMLASTSLCSTGVAWAQTSDSTAVKSVVDKFAPGLMAKSGASGVGVTIRTPTTTYFYKYGSAASGSSKALGNVMQRAIGVHPGAPSDATQLTRATMTREPVAAGASPMFDKTINLPSSGTFMGVRPIDGYGVAITTDRGSAAVKKTGQDILNTLTPTIDEQFLPPWNGVMSPDGVFRISGLWVGTGGNILDPALAVLSPQFQGTGYGFMSLTVKANEKRGAEIQSLPSYGYGYYESRIRVTSVPGVCDSFFWIEAPNYSPHEWDIEFLTNEGWIHSPNSGAVHLTLHPSNTTFTLQLPFNPSLAFHHYGFLWTPGQIVFTVDHQPVKTFNESDLVTTAHGYIMANTWTGNPYWGGGPPTQDATSVYGWVKYWPGATSIP